MRSFPKPCGNNNGGVRQFWFTPWRNVAKVPRVSGSSITEDIELIPGAKWYEGYGTFNKLGYKEPQKNTSQGPEYAAELSGQCPNDIPDIAELFDEMVLDNRYLVLYKDYNDKLKLSGDLEEPLQFTYALDTSNSFAGLKGYAYVFAAIRSKPSYFYLGGFETDDTVYEPEEPGTAGGEVQIVDQDANVVAVVTAPGTYPVLVISGINDDGSGIYTNSIVDPT